MKMTYDALKLKVYLVFAMKVNKIVGTFYLS